MNSDISIRTMASSVSKRNDASALHNSVLPTPVGPRNRNEPLGLEGSDSPERDRRTALATASTASSWPITRACKASSIRSSLSRSPSSIFDTGMPVHLETTSAISSSVTRLRSSVISIISAWLAISSWRSSSGMRPYCNSDILPRSPARRALSRSILACSNWLLIFCEPCNAAFSVFQISSRSAYSRSTLRMTSFNSSRRFLELASVSFFNASRSILSWIRRRSRRSSGSGLESISMRIWLPASSTRSIALSGNWRSAI